MGRTYSSKAGDENRHKTLTGEHIKELLRRTRLGWDNSMNGISCMIGWTELNWLGPGSIGGLL